jgi:hypothetical protein
MGSGMEPRRVRFVAISRRFAFCMDEKIPKQRHMDLELKDAGDVMREIATRLEDRERENLPSAYVILGMVEYASLQTQGLTQAIEEPGSGKRTILGLTILVVGVLGVRVIGAPEDAFNELVNAYAK